MGCVFSCIGQTWLAIIGAVKWIVLTIAEITIWLFTVIIDILVGILDILTCRCCRHSKHHHEGESGLYNEKTTTT